MSTKIDCDDDTDLSILDVYVVYNNENLYFCRREIIDSNAILSLNNK